MDNTATYNQEEVKELFEVVFKLSAKDIDDKLKKVTNRPEIAKRRWFWELLQNAKDAVKPTEKVSVKLIINSENDQPFVEFLHNGNPFRYQDAKNLIFPYSDKEDEENSDKSGRFGTGFLATHILSKTIKVKGIYLKDQQAFDFNFTLDRTGTDKPKIAESINNTWQEFREKANEVFNYSYDQKNFETSFRYDLDPESLVIASNSLSDFGISLPYGLSFIPKIETVEIDNKLDGVKTLFHKKEIKKLTETINQFVIEKTVIENGDTTITNINLIICTDGTMDIALEVLEKEGKTFIKEFLEHQPLLFCPFPLIGANDFKFPTVINSSSFIPKEERDGIWLDNAGYGISNQSLFEKVIPLYFSLCTYASSQNWKQTYLLFKSLNENILFADFNAKWFKEKVQSVLKSSVLQIPLVDIPNGQRLSASSIYFQNEAKEENRLQLWDFVKDIFPDNVPIKVEVNDWYKVIWEDCPRFSIGTFTKHIATSKTVVALQSILNKPKDETLTWLDSYVTFITKTEPTLLNVAESQILPNQYGNFKRKDELWLDDGTIDTELKEILTTLSILSKKVHDWRNDMLEKKIYLELPASRTRTLALIGTTITEIVKDLLRDDNPTNDLRDFFSRLYNWLIDNPQKSKDNFKGLKSDTLLYKCADEMTMGKFTEMFKLNRDGKLSVDKQIEVLKDPRIHLLGDPDLELKVRLGEQVLADLKQEKEEFIFKKQTGDIFEALFKQLINADNRFSIAKVEGEEDFIITNISSGNKFYIELKSIKNNVQSIQMTHKQAKKANEFPSSYFLCIIPNDGNVIDETYFKNNAKFDGTIGAKLANKVQAALTFEAPETGISVEFEDDLLRSYSKYRYKFTIQHLLWGQDNFDTFKTRLN
jgi:Domain of unknown function (DUF3883)